MNNNDVLRQTRYALNLPDAKMIKIFAKGGLEIDEEDLLDFMKKEEHEGYCECPNSVLNAFLDGLIIEHRGYRPPKPGTPLPDPTRINNNDILKKLRIALELKEQDMLECFKLGDFSINKAELSALFRSRGHRNYKLAGDQLLRYFLRGLTRKLRPAAQVSETAE